MHSKEAAVADSVDITIIYLEMNRKRIEKKWWHRYDTGYCTNEISQ